ncbi:MAG: chromosomal replication initiator protein DnaA [Ignavibacteria bacterium]|nr:chromosomal replication initiator protein DnaA [Ignavibacteria bacterium]
MDTNYLKASSTNENLNIDKQDSSKDEAEKVWKKFLDLLSDSTKESEIQAWFSVIVPKSFINNVLTLYVPSDDYYSIIERRFNKQITKILESGLLGEKGKLVYEVLNKEVTTSSKSLLPSPPDLRKDEKEVSTYPILISSDVDSIPKLDSFNNGLYSRYTFENFVRGDSNELAAAVAYAIAQNPGNLYNPFFVYGGVGIGKTHLIQAIGNEVVKRFPNKRVYYTTTPDFTTQFTSSIAKDRGDFSSGTFGTKKLDAFYKSLDVLILDDIQNLACKQGTQDFIYQIFNTLYNNNKHIIFSCDKPINQIKDIEERLVSRFRCGMIADIQPPSWEMRVAIIKRKLSELSVTFSEEIIHFIATNVTDSIRTIESCISGIITESRFLYNNQINLEIAERTLNRVIGHIRRTKNISIENIIYTVARYYKISENSILSKKRTKEVAFARQVAMYLAKQLTNLTLETIGLNFGGKDHATVLYAYNSIKELIKKDPNVNNQILEIREILNNL